PPPTLLDRGDRAECCRVPPGRRLRVVAHAPCPRVERLQTARGVCKHLDRKSGKNCEGGRKTWRDVPDDEVLGSSLPSFRLHLFLLCCSMSALYAEATFGETCHAGYCGHCHLAVRANGRSHRLVAAAPGPARPGRRPRRRPGRRGRSQRQLGL